MSILENSIQKNIKTSIIKKRIKILKHHNIKMYCFTQLFNSIKVEEEKKQYKVCDCIDFKPQPIQICFLFI